MDWPEVAAEVARGIAPKIHEGVINGAVVVIVLTGAGTILAKVRRSFTFSGDKTDLQRQLDELARRVERIEGNVDATNTRVAEIHGALFAGMLIKAAPKSEG